MNLGAFQRQVHLRQLRLLVGIAEQGSLARAADALHITQPAATKTLRQLEEIIGSSLVERSAGGSVLTPLGQVLYERAQAIMTEIREAEEELGLWHAGGTGHVTLGAMPVSTPALVPKALLKLATAAPRVTVQVIEGSSNTLLERLAQGDLDLVVGRFWRGEDPSVITEALYESAFRLHVRATHPLSENKTLSLAEVCRYTWMMPTTGAHIRAALEDMFRALRLTPPPHQVESTSYQVIRHMMLNSDVISPLPVEAFLEDIEAGRMRYLPVDLPLRLPPISILRNSKRAPSPAVLTMMQQLRQAGTEMGIYH
ncbi:LysR family transcriptional regulator [Pusillimonas sp. DMV24BSW_D]|uniref:LysR family transcriptional regulator n=1 Tax=Neopusillimonas aestuarii TaxID=2716226 RepID=UPI001407BE4B|nr:LysR family transcriptional regulator [Pusillimonas sp. DMV24BSW_D]QIM48802.1 LysR family transcriptional regulator [Pusillimonas sp. DMV24BSW_D]